MRISAEKHLAEHHQLVFSLCGKVSSSYTMPHLGLWDDAEETDMDCQATSHFSVSQCDFPSITGPISPAPIYVGVSCPAKRLLPQQRQDLAIQVLARTETVSELARQHEVSRKFLYQQVHTAEKALSEAFAPSSTADDVLFYLPVTKAWL